METLRLGSKDGQLEVVNDQGEVLETFIDYTLSWMIANNIKLTKENWLALDYVGDDGIGENLEGENLVEFLEISEYLMDTETVN